MGLSIIYLNALRRLSYRPESSLSLDSLFREYTNNKKDIKGTPKISDIKKVNGEINIDRVQGNGEIKINQVILFSNRPSGKYKCPNLREKEINIAITKNNASEKNKIAILVFLCIDVILLVIIIKLFFETSLNYC